jgi:hypothetical protein
LESVSFVIRCLREWARYPGYSVERRIDVLLAPYLGRALGAKMRAPVTLVAAEFPLPHRLFKGEESTRQHRAAEFLCLRGGDDPAWILVELKTDRRSKSDAQLRAYRAVCSNWDMPRVLDAILVTKAETNHEAAYRSLVRMVRQTKTKTTKFELCLIEPTSTKVKSRENGPAGQADAKAREWVVGLREFTGLVVPERGDILWPALVKLLRGVASSAKGRGL